jgi:putative transposase
MPRPRRKPLRVSSFDYASSGAYFVTVCTLGRRCILGSIENDRMQLNRIGRLVERCWLETPAHFPAAELDTYVVMPNHVQAIVFLWPQATHASPLRLGTVVGSFKATASRLSERPLWQRGYHDRVLRDEGELQAFRRYIAQNPLKWALDRENSANL